jgi:two-component system chemotaxis response regulator CheB
MAPRNETGRSRRDVVVIGASTGGVAALSRLFSELPADLKALVAATMHRGASGGSNLAAVLGRNARIRVTEATRPQFTERSRVYLAPPDYHLIIRPGRLELDRGAKQHHTRPAIDPMFASAARSYGRRVIGVLLTGHLGDGTGGLIEIKQRGGLCLVQDPEEAAAPSMPRSALEHDHVDLVFRLRALPAVLEALLQGETLTAVQHNADARKPRPTDTRNIRD